MKYLFLIFLSIVLINNPLFAQEISVEEIKSRIKAYKSDIRGPYHRIKWFCKDGTIRDPKDPCPLAIGGGIQHASYKEEVEELGRLNHIYLGEILAYTDKKDFWDKEHNHSRLKQYQLNKYLGSVDDGWILRKGQFYRGAVQSEDEEAWGLDFYDWLLSKNEAIEKHFFLIRQSLKDIPHNGDTNLAQEMRSQSKVLAEKNEAFMDARIKIHGNPDKSDISLVQKFKEQHSRKLSTSQVEELEELISTMKAYYTPVSYQNHITTINGLKGATAVRQSLIAHMNAIDKAVNIKDRMTAISEALCDIRLNILNFDRSNDRLSLLEISNSLEQTLVQSVNDWQPTELKGVLDKIYTLSFTLSGTGFIEQDEWNAARPLLIKETDQQAISLDKLNNSLIVSRNIISWSTEMVRAVYMHDVNKYGQFEPLSYGFIDDVIRSSATLSLGNAVNQLSAMVAQKSNIRNDISLTGDFGQLRGLNPGYAKGKLVIVDRATDVNHVDSDHIYVFHTPPSDLKPVAGIMSVTEGNLVSHVQLLARNLGIPNAALGEQELNQLRPLNGQTIFYAVTDKGNVVIKKESEMTTIEKDLFDAKSKTQQKKSIKVPTKDIVLTDEGILSMSDVNATHSGKTCGPKAANLGQLKNMFPDHVVNGLVIPFGIFKSHMNLKMPNQNGLSYWEFLIKSFEKANSMRSENAEEKEIIRFQLSQLEILHKAILNIKLEPTFISALKNQFLIQFGNSLGNVPVFLRSDTNMEDLEEFTGAGLNLTLFNIKNEAEILQGIKRVWASPYTERSFKWRQKYLLNPEAIYPSILVIPSVDVDYSGVMITKGINVGDDSDLTVAFSRGAGGAVDGQQAETVLITPKSSYLLTPARQADYIRLPVNGGVSNHYATFEERILSDKNIDEIRAVAKKIRSVMPTTTHRVYDGAYDVELGFKNDKLWLFQIRPFVENVSAKKSAYLKSITPTVDYTQQVSLSAKIQ